MLVRSVTNLIDPFIIHLKSNSLISTRYSFIAIPLVWKHGQLSSSQQWFRHCARISTYFHSFQNYSKQSPSLQLASHLVANFSNWSQKFPLKWARSSHSPALASITTNPGSKQGLFICGINYSPEVLTSPRVWTVASTSAPSIEKYTPNWVRMGKPLPSRALADESE